MKKEIILSKSTDKILGSLRCSERVYIAIEKMVKENNSTKQDIIRAISENLIDEIIIK